MAARQRELIWEFVGEGIDAMEGRGQGKNGKGAAS